MYTWRHFGLAMLVFLAVSGFFNFVAGTQTTLSNSARLLDACKVASMTLLLGLALGFTIWGGLRLIKGAGAPDVRETVMVLATLVGIVAAATVLSH